MNKMAHLTFAKIEIEIESENQKWRSGAKMIDRENRSAYDKKH